MNKREALKQADRMERGCSHIVVTGIRRFPLVYQPGYYYGIEATDISTGVQFTLYSADEWEVNWNDD